jgi:hypothetical protein
LDAANGLSQGQDAQIHAEDGSQNTVEPAEGRPNGTDDDDVVFILHPVTSFFL